jgi:polysaccharide pyruvyl transferase WcaK-like protein
MKRLRLGHIGIHEKANLNSGDTLLFQAVRDIFERILDTKIEWNLYQVWENFDSAIINHINSENDALILGGGGLFLKDQKGADIASSGWQWNCSPNNVLEIKIPLFIFAVGYNRFYDQEDFDQNFTDSINAICSISPFFSLRNNGSINAIKGYLYGENLKQAKIFRQFCPTTMLSMIYPEFKDHADNQSRNNSKVLSFNAAFDRTELRFPDAHKAFNEICKLIKHAEEEGWSIIACSHKEMDREIETFLYNNNVKYETKDLTTSSPSEIMEHYAQIDLSVGMRGHSQMIPFGFNKPIISLISHDKLQFFLNDIDFAEYGIDMNSSDIKTQFVEILKKIEIIRPKLINKLKEKQMCIWEETLDNFEIMEEILN